MHLGPVSRLLVACSAALLLAMASELPAVAAESRPVHPWTIPPMKSTPRAGDSRAPGTQLWVQRYNGPGTKTGPDVASSIGVSPDGSKVFVTGGATNFRGTGDYATIAYTSSGGNMLWTARYSGPQDRSNFAYSLAVSPDGSMVFVTGTSYQPPGNVDFATVAYNASTGTQLWVELYNGPGDAYDFAYSLAVSPDGSKIFVTGASDQAPGNADYATIAYEASTGATLWVEFYDGPDHSSDSATSLGVSPDGSHLFVTGSSFSPDSLSDYVTVAYDASTGTRLWLERYDGPDEGSVDSAVSLGPSPDGTKVFVTGTSGVSLELDDYATVAYDASTGGTLWVERYNGPLNNYDSAFSLGVSPDGAKVFVTGQSMAQYTHIDYTTIAYDASSGGILWLMRYYGPRPDKRQGQDGARSLGIGPDGTKVFVTGASEAKGGNYDYATVAYDASAGTQLWVQRYSGPADMTDFAHALGVSPEGSRVFVTGESVGYGTDPDYATIAYSTT
jgi:hypothetical protein